MGVILKSADIRIPPAKHSDFRFILEHRDSEVKTFSLTVDKFTLKILAQAVTTYA